MRSDDAELIARKLAAMASGERRCRHSKRGRLSRRRHAGPRGNHAARQGEHEHRVRRGERPEAHRSGLRGSADRERRARPVGARVAESAVASATPKGCRTRSASRYAQMEDLAGLWFANINVAPQNVAKAIDRRAKRSTATRREGPTDAEIEEQKSFFAGNYRVGLGSNGGIADALVAALRHGFGPSYLDTFPAAHPVGDQGRRRCRVAQALLRRPDQSRRRRRSRQATRHPVVLDSPEHHDLSIEWTAAAS